MDNLYLCNKTLIDCLSMSDVLELIIPALLYWQMRILLILINIYIVIKIFKLIHGKTD